MNEHHLKEDIFKILRILSSRDDFSQRDLSGHLGMSLGKTNYLIKSLAQKGFIKIKNFSKRGSKLKKVGYMLTSTGLEQKIQLTYFFLKRKEKEYLDLKEEIEKETNK